MRIIVNCTGGGSHSMMLLDSTTVHDLKQHIERKEGVPVHQQLLLFAGQVLCPDSALLLDHLGLDKFSLAHEVVVYMQRQLAEPVLVYLCQPGPAPCQLHAETVEAHSTLANIMGLLQQRKLASRPFPVAAGAASTQRQGPAAARASTHSSRSSVADSSSGGAGTGSAGESAAGGSVILPSCVVVKRQDGSCCSRVRVTEGCSISQLQDTIQQVEGVAPSHLSFCQAQDGCLHVVWGPSADSSSNSHTVYNRSSMPQTTMLVKKDIGNQSMPLSALVKEQAVMP
ncbi:hypothetical protein OEZ86_009913 [Tetradesmus obliquus]|uniref:Ubiquitin-like domain-containing protein n=1 Tax=Tetradesmus obliquus TaxID=3088 RepID=A0ABY8UNY6_TETOB|nr:hypothetical protein OEZ85_001350 [Tetradesmus obliquus]WIA43445.1 hypothetical protein OEZ86_009913 [Tetradesmus obliquus]